MMKGIPDFLLVTTLLSLTACFVSAYDPSPLQDFCVAIDDPKAGVFVNGKFCKDPKLANANDFFFSGLQIPRNTSNPVGSTVTPVNVAQIAGLNTLEYPWPFNVGYGNAVALAGLSSQNPGVITIANAVFGSNPPINPDVLSKAFQVDKKVIDYL
ncbi:Germin-like protein subfamily 1 member 20 [Morella rubra]|uniref:Germin-like protein subfamily 1 member 20 n=1 Tax=Morella rubra TaxID=262757 RepID=A0A6A1USA7_9ROSI|nr:Germin-like protein subfamily 1 member 20 [Morella rubra]